MPVQQGEKGNILLTPDVIAKESLRLLKNNLVMAKLVYRGLESTFGKVGDTINVRKPFRTKSASGRVLVKQPMVDQTIPFKIDHHEHVGLEYTVRDKSLTIEQFSDRYLRSGMVQIANKMDRSVLLTLRQAFFSSNVGKPVSLKAFLMAQAFQNDVAVQDDGLRRAVMNSIDCAEMSDQLVKSFNEAIVKDIITKGYKGNLGGYDTYESANIPNHVVGAYDGAGQVDGANQNGDQLKISGLTGNLNEGDVFTIAGVYEINPQSYEVTSSNRLMNFVVTKDITLTGNDTISISPAINDGTPTSTDLEGNTVSLKAYQNIDKPIVNGAEIKVLGKAGESYNQDFLFHRDAIGLVMPDLELPSSAPIKYRASADGYSLSITGDYDITQHSEITRIDTIWGTRMIYPELAHRIWTTPTID